MAYESFTLHEMSPACGGLIEGIDLSKDLTNRQFDEIHDALLDRTVIVFRDQHITPDQQVMDMDETVPSEPNVNHALNGNGEPHANGESQRSLDVSLPTLRRP